MIELIIKHYLEEDSPVPVFLEEQNDERDRYVLIQKTGSHKKNHICSSTFIFQSYAESLYESAVLNETIKRLVENLIELDEIGSVKLNSDYSFTDTQSKKYRYQAVFDITHY